MVTVDINEAKKQLSRLVDRPPKGFRSSSPKAGKPLVKVSAVDAPALPQRLGFLTDEIVVPDDFDRLAEASIAAMFGARVRKV